MQESGDSKRIFHFRLDQLRARVFSWIFSDKLLQRLCLVMSCVAYTVCTHSTQKCRIFLKWEKSQFHFLLTNLRADKGKGQGEKKRKSLNKKVKTRMVKEKNIHQWTDINTWVPWHGSYLNCWILIKNKSTEIKLKEVFPIVQCTNIQVDINLESLHHMTYELLKKMQLSDWNIHVNWITHYMHYMLHGTN